MPPKFPCVNLHSFPTPIRRPRTPLICYVSKVFPFLGFPYSERHMPNSKLEQRTGSGNAQNSLPHLATQPRMAKVSLDLGNKFFCLFAEVVIVT